MQTNRLKKTKDTPETMPLREEEEIKGPTPRLPMAPRMDSGGLRVGCWVAQIRARCADIAGYI